MALVGKLSSPTTCSRDAERPDKAQSVHDRLLRAIGLSDVELCKSGIHPRPMKSSKLISCINASIPEFVVHSAVSLFAALCTAMKHCEQI